MITLIPYDPIHIQQMTIVSEPNMEIALDIDQWAESMNEGEAYTAICEEGIIGCAGVRPLWHGVGEAWMCASPLLMSYQIGTIKAMQKMFDDIISRNGYVRIQCIVNENIHRGMPFAKFFGFQVEGLLRKYFNNEDYILLSRIGGIE